MAATWEKADRHLIELADRVIRKYRPELVNARIGFLFRSEDGSSQGKRVIGKAQKVPARLAALLDLDFIIWISRSTWMTLVPEKREALLHHELCHCQIDTGSEECSIVAHDVEEFNAVIEAHGFWTAEVKRTAEAMQPYIPGLEREGKVVAVDPEIGGEDLEGDEA